MLTNRRPSIRCLISIARCCATVIALLFLELGEVKAEESRVVYVPMIFHAEARDFQTSACLQVNEHIYPQSGWWQDPAGDASAPERAFKGVIAAIQRKDRAALLRLTDPLERKDVKRFDEQAGAFFQQFEVLELVAVPRAYEFDGLAVFFVRLRAQQGMAFVPFVFALEADGSFGFLPRRTQKTSFNVLSDWFDGTSGPAASSHPAYCMDDIKRATHRVSLSSSPDAQAGNASQLLLRGASLAAPEESATLAARVKARIDEMKAAFARGGIDDFLKYMTPEGGSRLKEWFVSADEKERSQYKTEITQQQPFFFFDLSSVVVVYTRSSGGSVQVMYFTFGHNKELLWTNSSHLTTADQVFKKGSLYDAALSDKPFSSIAIK